MMSVTKSSAGADSFQFGQMFGADRTIIDAVAPGDEIAAGMRRVRAARVAHYRAHP